MAKMSAQKIVRSTLVAIAYNWNSDLSLWMCASECASEWVSEWMCFHLDEWTEIRIWKKNRKERQTLEFNNRITLKAAKLFSSVYTSWTTNILWYYYIKATMTDGRMLFISFINIPFSRFDGHFASFSFLFVFSRILHMPNTECLNIPSVTGVQTMAHQFRSPIWITKRICYACQMMYDERDE